MPKGAEQVNTQRTLTKKPADPTPPHEPRQRTKMKGAQESPPCQMRVKSGKYVPALALLKGD